MEHVIFSWLDYFVFVGLLVVSLVIGVYFGFFSKQDTTTEYLFGGKTMGYIPVAISLLSSFLSGITILAVPTEVYLYGAKLTICIFTAIGTGFITIHLFLPTFFKLQLPCTNTYLELRFSKAVRKLCSLVYVIGLLVLMAVIIYVPALAFAQMTGFNLHTVTPVLSLVCLTYTSMGGVKAVVWTDTFQFVFALIGFFAILGIGIHSVGGITEVLRISSEGGRTEIFDMNLSIFERNTFWAFFFGLLFTCTARISVSQKFVQKFLAVHEEQQARKSIWLMTLGWVVTMLICVLLGLTMYAKYHGCDPYTANVVDRTDQTLPYFVLDVAGHIPGLPGLFLSGLVSSSLATQSACLNTLGGMIYDDFIEELIPESPSKEKRAASIMKAIVVILGLISIGFVFVIEKLGTIFEMVTSISSVLDGPVLGLFTLGMLFPCAGKKGALVGGSTSLLVMVLYVGQVQWNVIHQRIRYETLSLSVDECPMIMNETIETPRPSLPPLEEEDVPIALFRVSILYFSFIGTTIVLVVGLLTSWLTNEMDSKNVNPDHICPLLHRFLPKSEYKAVPLKSVNASS